MRATLFSLLLFTEGVGQAQETTSCSELPSSCGTNEQLNPLDGNGHFVTARCSREGQENYALCTNCTCEANV